MIIRALCPEDEVEVQLQGAGEYACFADGPGAVKGTIFQKAYGGAYTGTGRTCAVSKGSRVYLGVRGQEERAFWEKAGMGWRGLGKGLSAAGMNVMGRGGGNVGRDPG